MIQLRRVRWNVILSLLMEYYMGYPSKQYVVIACGGSKWGGNKSDSYVAFALPGH